MRVLRPSFLRPFGFWWIQASAVWLIALAACQSEHGSRLGLAASGHWQGPWPATDTRTFASQFEETVDVAIERYAARSDAATEFERALTAMPNLWATALFLSDPGLSDDLRHRQWPLVLWRNIPSAEVAAIEGVPAELVQPLAELQGQGACDHPNLVDLYVHTARVLANDSELSRVELLDLASRVETEHPRLNVTWLARLLALEIDQPTPLRPSVATGAFQTSFTLPDVDAVGRVRDAFRYAIHAHDVEAKTDQNRSRRFDGLTPFGVHPVWIASTLLADASIPLLDRLRYFRVLLFHDVFEDTTSSGPADLTAGERALIQSLTFDEQLSGPEKTDRILSSGLVVVFLKMHDAIANLLDWCPRPNTSVDEAQQKWRAKVGRLDQLRAVVEPQLPGHRIVQMARAMAALDGPAHGWGLCAKD